MKHKQFEDFILSLDNVYLDYPFGDKVAVYKVGEKPDGKIAALVQEGSHPLSVSLKCDPQLAVYLREKYETVQPGYHLNKKHWNTILCTGQLPDSEVFDLARISHRLASGEKIIS